MAQALVPGFKVAETEVITKRREPNGSETSCRWRNPRTGPPSEKWNKSFPDISEAEVQEGLVKLRAERDKLLSKQGKVEGEIEKLPELESELAAMEENLPEPPNPRGN
jgi:hypothetical protein